MEYRAEKVIALIGILRECMERQTEVAKTANDLLYESRYTNNSSDFTDNNCSPLLPAGPVDVDLGDLGELAAKQLPIPIDSPMIPVTHGCTEDEIEDSGFMDEHEIADSF
jgi:hypothetical protein